MKIRAAVTALALFGAGFAPAIVALPAAAAEAYPQRAVRLIIPFPPGGAGDIIGRLLGAGLSDALGQQVVTDNRGGGGQVIATQIAANANPDGYTLLLASATHAVNPALRKNLPYDTLKDFAPITLVAQSPLVFVAHPSLGVSNINELISAAKAKPGSINYASSGPGTGGHMSVELLKSMTGVDLVHIPFKGAGPALTALIAGQVHVMCTSPLPSMPHVKTGKLRALAMTGPKRTDFAPEVPAVAETLPGYQTTLWYAVVAPAGTPQAILRRLNEVSVKTIKAQQFGQRLAALGAEPIGSTPQALQAHIRSEIAQWTKLVKQAKITIN